MQFAAQKTQEQAKL